MATARVRAKLGLGLGLGLGLVGVANFKWAMARATAWFRAKIRLGLCLLGLLSYG